MPQPVPTFWLRFAKFTREATCCPRYCVCTSALDIPESAETFCVTSVPTTPLPAPLDGTPLVIEPQVVFTPLTLVEAVLLIFNTPPIVRLLLPSLLKTTTVLAEGAELTPPTAVTGNVTIGANK